MGWEGYLFDVHTPIPAQPNRLRAFRLFQPAKVQFQILIVHVD